LHRSDIHSPYESAFILFLILIPASDGPRATFDGSRRPACRNGKSCGARRDHVLSLRFVYLDECNGPGGSPWLAGADPILDGVSAPGGAQRRPSASTGVKRTRRWASTRRRLQAQPRTQYLPTAPANPLALAQAIGLVAKRSVSYAHTRCSLPVIQC
jgi:hypothetical protein